MSIQYLKKSPKTSSIDDTKTAKIVQDLLKDIESSKEQGCIDLTKKFDKYDGEIVVSKERIDEIKKTLDQKTKDDVQFSYDRVRKFAEAQLKNYGQDFEVELSKGLYAGQKLVPVNTAGCYVPGGRYAHISSAVMSVTTAAAIEANLAGAAADLLVITTGTFPPITTPAAHAPIK